MTFLNCLDRKQKSKKSKKATTAKATAGAAAETGQAGQAGQEKQQNNLFVRFGIFLFSCFLVLCYNKIYAF